MTASLSWYLASSLLGWLTFPLVFRLFPALADRGYTLARAAGILLWGWLFWILASLGLLRNDLGGVLFAFIALVALSAYSIVNRKPFDSAQDKSEIVNFLRSHKSLLLVTELLFLASFAFLAFVRASNPEAVGTEKPMELAFINAILRSPTLPPNDPWLSGYSISYYHFGYILTAMFARLTGTSGNVAFNLMSALVFALAAVGSYGILYNLLAAYAGKQVDTDDVQSKIVNQKSLMALALLAPLFLLILSNLEGLLEIFHALGWFWPSTLNVERSTFNVWTWLNLKDLNEAPTGGGWMPDRYLWWWRASRVVSDFDLLNNSQEIIDEFPAFSFVLGDLHPHILSLPFTMLGIGVALNIFLGGWRGIVKFLDFRLRTTPLDFFFAVLVLGGLAFLNTWDILPIAALIVGAYLLARVHDEGWGWQRIEDALLLGVPLAASAFVLYLPFYVGFSSQAGGLLPNLINPTRGAHLWVMWGTLLLPLLAYLIYLTRDRATRPRYFTALAWTLGGILFLWAFSWLLGLAAQSLEPNLIAQYLQSQNQPDVASFFQAALARRLSYIGGLLTIAFVSWLSLSNLLKVGKLQVESSTSQPSNLQPSTFNLLLILLASLLIIIPDFVYLRDLFSYRINTVFKFYYQAWQLWAIAAAFGTAVLLQNLRGVWNVAWRILLGLILVAGMIYPVFAFANKTNNFNPPFDYTLDASAHLDTYNPEDAAAIRFLQSAPLGVVAEAIGGSYSYATRMSTYSGQPTVLGWSWHEIQWRGDRSPQGTRETDIKTLYESRQWDEAKAVIERYNIRYIVIGGLERNTYNVNEAKFQQRLVVIFQAGNTVIYGVP
ncbi:MAG: hypothetical protein HY867_15860 [Chloroflexi bacterium]|nr:hypothetical protein [Chloroflexota bacterium]